MLDFHIEPQMRETPFFFEGITQDEYLTENTYFLEVIANSVGKAYDYKSLRQQLLDGEITEIPKKYKRFCIDPEWDKLAFGK